MTRFEGRVALVTGGASGIGKATAKRIAAEGGSVVIADVQDDLGTAVVAEIEASGGTATYVHLDVTDEQGWTDAVASTVDTFGGLDVLVNNAASTARGYLEDAPVELWDAIMHVNLRAPFLCLQEAVRSMKARGGGSIVNIGSINAYIGEPKLGPYSVSKGGLMTLTKNAAAALSRYRIRVNQINVGWTLTEGEERVKRVEEGRGPEWLAQAVAAAPFGRLLAPHDIALAAAYFASDDSAIVTGTVMDFEQSPVGAPANR